MTRRLAPLVLVLATTALGCQAPEEIGGWGQALTGGPVDLIAIGTLDANQGDRSSATAGLLENGVPGNLLGGIGSGLAYAGGDLVAVLTAHGIAAKDIPAKLAGLAFGPDVVVDGATRHTLFVGNDNDFLATITDTGHPAGIANPNTFFVLGIDPAALPGFVPQQLGEDDAE